MAPQKDAGEDLSMRRRRLRYRAWHRGTKELDLILGPFADAMVGDMGAAELTRLETLLEEEETDLQSWLLGQELPPAHVDHDFLARLVVFRLKHVSS